MASPSKLDYRTPSGKRRLRVGWKSVLAAAIVCIVAWQGPRFLAQAAYLYRQHACMTHTPEPDEIAFTWVPGEAEVLLSQGLLQPTLDATDSLRKGHEVRTAAYRPIPNVLKQLAPIQIPNATSPCSGDGVAFLHERRSPSGKRFLVVVPFYTQVDEYGMVDFIMADGHVLEPASWTPGSTLRHVFTLPIRFRISPSYYYRILSGHPDPNDASRFSIAFDESNPYYGPTYRGHLDFQVTDDGSLLMERGPRKSELSPRQIPVKGLD